MEEFIRRENIKHYRRLLDSTIDEGERGRILELIAAEEAREREARKGKILEKK